MNPKQTTPLERLQHHVTGAIERGEAQAIVAIEKPMKTIDQQLNEMIPQWVTLIAQLIPDIADDYRASDDPDDETPGMQLTIGFTPESEDVDACWSYQTGDNSYSGGAYSHRHWGVVSLYRDSDPKEVAEEIANQIGELICQ